MQTMYFINLEPSEFILQAFWKAKVGQAKIRRVGLGVNESINIYYIYILFYLLQMAGCSKQIMKNKFIMKIDF